MEDTSGFYKNDDGMLLYGKNYVLTGSYNLYREQKDNYEYPIGGWKWFDTEQDARLHYNITKKEDPTDPQESLFLMLGIKPPPNI
jgi:hypothetical protein